MTPEQSAAIARIRAALAGKGALLDGGGYAVSFFRGADVAILLSALEEAQAVRADVDGRLFRRLRVTASVLFQNTVAGLSLEDRKAYLTQKTWLRDCRDDINAATEALFPIAAAPALAPGDKP